MTKRIETPRLLSDIPENANILICDGVLTSGTTLSSAVMDLLLIYPKAKFYAAITWLEEGIEKLSGIEHIFYGKRTNEKKQSKNTDCINGMIVAPWEDFEIDWNEIKNY